MHQTKNIITLYWNLDTHSKVKTLLTFFRVYAFYHAIALIIVLLGIRFLMTYGHISMPLINSELEAFVIGEKMAGGSLLYKNIWASISPLSGGIYWLGYLIVGRSQTGFQAIALGICVIQIFYFNYTLNNRYAYLEKTYLPGLVYLLFMHLSFDFFTLSPALLANTFLLFALGTVIKQLDKRDGISDEIFEAGLFIGIATLFHLPSFVFIFWLSFAVLFFTGASVRQHFLILIGFSLPIFGVFIFFFFGNNLTQFQYCWFSTLDFFSFSKYQLHNLTGILVAFIIPIIFTVLGFYQISRTTRYSNYQTRIQQIMFLWIAIGVVYFLIIPELMPSQLIILVPAFAFFTVHFFLNFRKKGIPDLVFLAFFVGVILVAYMGIDKKNSIAQMTNFRLDDSNKNPEMNGKKVLIIGDNISEYQHSLPATSYLSWALAKIDLQNPDSYESVINIFYNFREDPPEYIIDKENVIPKIFKRLPAIAQNYTETQIKGVYRKIK